MKYNLDKDIDYAKTILDMNDSQIAEFLDISGMTLYRWRKGKAEPSAESLEKIYDRLYHSGINLNRVKEEMYASKMPMNHVLLFHGAKKELIGKPSISHSEEKKDFGKGFYLGESFNQSASFVVGYKESSIYLFDFDMTDAKILDLNVSMEWMLLIAYFRKRINEYENSEYLKRVVSKMDGVDVVIAPIADNTMYTTLDDFIQGKITDLQCLNALSANRLGRQYVFLNDDFIDKNLKMLDRCFYPTGERIDYQSYRQKENEIGKNKVKLAMREYAGKGKYIEDILS